MSKKTVVVDQLMSELPFKEALNWTSFQTLCTDVLFNRFGISDARDYLGQGSIQDGIDCYGIEGVGERLICAQCKLENYLSPKALDKLIDIFINGEFAQRTHEFILCTNFDLGRQRDHERHLQSIRDKLSQINIKFVVWDKKGLSTELRNNPLPHIVNRYFGSEIALAFYGEVYEKWLRSLRKLKKPAYELDPNYVSRKLATYQDHQQTTDNPAYLFWHNRYLELTGKIAGQTHTNDSRFLIMGTAGFGKTIELEHLAGFFALADQYLFPIKSYLIDYEGQEISELLDLHQPGWQDLEDDALLLILDGLDDIREIYFQTFINHLNQFAQAKPKASIVVSTRFNFYDLVTNPLRGFEVLILQPFGEENVKYYLDKHITSQANSFLSKVRTSRLQEFLQIPYYLARLVRFYGTDTESFPTTRAELFSRILFERFDADNRRKGNQVLRSEFFKLTQQIAFGMTRLGKSAMGVEEMNELLGDDTQINLIQSFFLLNKHAAAPDSWSFEHKNLQEYLCAKVLEPLSLIKIRELVTYPHDQNQVEPRFVNTLSFLFLIADENGPLFKELLAWLTTEQKELLVRFEKDRILPTMRLELFKQILSQYRDQDKALYSSSNFTLEELMDFIRLDSAIINYLEQEMMTDATGWYAMNGADLLAHCQKPYVHAVQLKKLLFQLLDSSFDNQIKFNALHALVRLEIIDKVLFEKIFLLPLNHDLPEIRQSMIQLLHGKPFLEDYIDFLIGSLAFFEHQENHMNHIGSAEFLKTILLQVNQPDSIRKLIFYVLNDINALALHDHHSDARLDAKEFQALLEKANTYFPGDEELREQVYQFYKRDSPITVYSEWLNPVLDYFRANGGLSLQFYRAYGEKPVDNHLMPLADEVTCDFLIEEFRNGKIREAQMIIYRNVLSHVNPPLFRYFYDALIREFGQTFQIPDINVNYQAHWDSYKQKNQAMLIDQALYLQELSDIFDALGMAAVTKKDVHDYDNYKLRAFRQSIVLHFLRIESGKLPHDISYFKGLISAPEDWTWHKIEEVYRLYDQKAPNGERFVGTDLRDFAIDWLREKIAKFDFTHSVKDTGPGQWVYNRHVEFVCRLFLRVNPELSDLELLKILPADFHSDINIPDQSIAAVVISKVIDKSLLRKSVIDYLNMGLATYVQKTLFTVCYKLDYTECAPTLYQFIRENGNLTGSDRCGLTGHYLALGGDILDFVDMLVSPPYKVLTNDISWEWFLLDKFLKVEPQRVAELMLDILTDEKRDPYHQMTAMHNLISLGRIEGLKFWADRSIALHSSPFENIIDPIRPHILEMESNAVVAVLFFVLNSFIEMDAQIERRRIRELMSDFIADLLLIIVKDSPKTFEGINNELNKLAYTDLSVKALYWINRYIDEITQAYQVLSHPEPTITDVRKELTELFTSH
ncbi:MAG: hypothetical protein V4456_11150 [Bacteroidota bacterium]